MLALAAVLLGLIAGLVSGGSLRSLADRDAPHVTVLLVLFVVQALLRGPLAPALGSAAIAGWAAVSLALIGLVILRMRSSLGVMIASVGISSNLVVVLLNQGMPVVPSDVLGIAATVRAVRASEGFYTLADQRTSLRVLGDVLPAGSGYASLGDVLLVVGVAIVIAQMMQPNADSLSSL